MNDRVSMDASTLERARIRASFDRAATDYDRAASLQRRAAERLLDRACARGIAPRAILDAGCGTGHGATLLAGRFPRAALCCLDIAPSMLVAARQRTAARDVYVCADAAHLPLRAQAFDLLWSNAMLQWCDDLAATLAGLARVLTPEGLLAFSTFGPQTLRELRAAFADDTPHVSRFADAQTIVAALQGAGFDRIEIAAHNAVLHYPDVHALMRALKTIGAGNATRGRARGLTGKALWRAMSARYEALREPRGLPATYELIHVTACKK